MDPRTTTVRSALAQMNQPPEFWTTVSANLLILVLGSALATISYLAYRRERERSFRLAALGFAFVTLGNLTTIIYQTTIKRSYFLGGPELLRLQTIGGTLVMVGLLVLLYSLYRH